jgi:hypothetical protein
MMWVSGSPVMQNNKKINKSISASIFLAVLLMGGGILVAEENKQDTALTAENEGSSGKKTQKQKVDNAVTEFVSKEKISADQAVAFPTDI